MAEVFAVESKKNSELIDNIGKLEKFKDLKALKEMKKTATALIEEIKKPEYFVLTLYLIRETRESYMQYGEKLQQEPGSKQTDLDAERKKQEVLIILDSVQLLIENSKELKKGIDDEDDGSFNTFVLNQVMVILSLAFKTTFSSFSVETILPDLHKDNKALLYQVVIGMILLKVEIGKLEKVSSKIGQKYASQITEARNLQIELLEGYKLTDLNFILIDEQGGAKLEELASHTLFNLNCPSKDYSQESNQADARLHLDKRRGVLLKELLPRLRKLQEIIAAIIAEKKIKLPVLQEQLESKNNEISKSLQKHIMLEKNNFSLLEIHGLQTALLTNASNKYWIDLVESAGKNTNEVELEYFTDLVKDSLIYILQSEAEVRMNAIISDPNSREALLNLVIGSLENYFSINNKTVDDSLVESFESLNLETQSILYYIQNETGIPFLLEYTTNNKICLSCWFFQFKDNLIETLKAIKESQALSFQFNNVKKFIEYTNKYNKNVRFEIIDNHRNDLLYSENSELQDQMLEALETVKNCVAWQILDIRP